MVPSLVWIFAGICLNTGGEYFSKCWANEPCCCRFSSSICLYTIASLFWFPALLKKNEIVVMGISWQIMAIVFTTFLGLFVFGECVTPKQWLGVALAAIAIFLLY
jgi:multidrug transporter EmrE-like cation transporter